MTQAMIEESLEEHWLNCMGWDPHVNGWPQRWRPPIHRAFTPVLPPGTKVYAILVLAHSGRYPPERVKLLTQEPGETMRSEKWYRVEIYTPEEKSC